MIIALLVILIHAVAAILMSWGYFRRYAITRPLIGVFNLWDIAIMIGGIVLVPYLYLALPRWLVAGLLTLSMASALYFMGEPVLRRRWLVWLATLISAGLDIGTAVVLGTAHATFLIVNNLVLIYVIVGLTNLWAQSGMKARDAAVLAGMLTIYDFVATWRLPLMTDMLDRLAGLPFAPLVAWPVGRSDLWLGIGLGDLLLAAVFPLVMRKAFGRRAGVAALLVSLGCLTVVLTLPVLGIIHTTFPVMIMLGPLMVLQYIIWRQRRAERTTWQYLRDEPVVMRVAAEPK